MSCTSFPFSAAHNTSSAAAVAVHHQISSPPPSSSFASSPSSSSSSSSSSLSPLSYSSLSPKSSALKSEDHLQHHLSPLRGTALHHHHQHLPLSISIECTSPPTGNFPITNTHPLFAPRPSLPSSTTIIPNLFSSHTLVSLIRKKERIK